MAKKAAPGTMKKVLSYIGKYKLLLPISAILALITVVTTLYFPVLIGDAIDCIIEYRRVDFSAMKDILNKTAALIIITALSQWLMSTINNRIAYHVVRDIRNDAFAKIQALPLSSLDKKARGDTVNRVINDAEKFAEGLLLGFTQVFTGVLTIIGALVFMLLTNAMITVAVVIITPLSIFVAKFIGSRTYSMFRLRSECEADATAAIDEVFGNQKLVQAFSREQAENEKFYELNDKLEGAARRAIFFSSLTNPTTRFVNNVVYAAVALIGAFAAMTPILSVSVLTVGQYTRLLSYSNQYTKPFNEISGIVAEFQNALACASRIFELIEEPVAKEETDKELSLTSVKGEVELRDVSFSYTEDRPLIEDFSFVAKPGQRIAIVGPTGCGKTTLINLLMRFYDVKGGAILLDGENVIDVTKRSLRQSFGMVLQDTWLKEGTVKENIAFGNESASDEQIISAAKAAHAHSFIKRLKNGYDTKLGEGGEGLSQGQKQLLCIARVMLTLPPMLILDEATSSIDTRTEIRIQKAFSAMMRGRTTFVVAHRLSTIIDADAIIVMKDGHIMEVGRHDELLKKGGFYSTIYNSQFAK